MAKKIIVEGFWQMGKSTLCRHLASRYGYRFIAEPDHRGEAAVPLRLAEWYATEHLKRMGWLLERPVQKAVAERSLISTLAFAWAAAEDATALRDPLDRFIESYASHRPKLVFLFSDDQDVVSRAGVIGNAAIAARVADPRFVRRYADFFERQAQNYGFAPTFIPARLDGKFVPVEDLAATALAADSSQ